MKVLANGSVGINDTTPTYALDVNGTLRATGAGTFDSTLVSTGLLTASAGVKTAFNYPASDSTTAYQVRKADGSTVVFNVDTTNSRLGINVTPTYTLDISGSAAPWVYQLTNTNGSGSTGGSGIRMVADDGAALASGDRVALFGFCGSKDASHTIGCAGFMELFTTEAWSSTATGSKLQLSTVANTTTTKVVQMVIDQDGSLTMTSTPSSGGATGLCWDNSGASIWGGCTSLREYKDKIEDLHLGLDTVLKLRPVTFNWKSSGQHDLGFIAEEVNDVDPLLAEYANGDKLSGVKYDKLTAILVNAIKELNRKIEHLERQCK